MPEPPPLRASRLDDPTGALILVGYRGTGKSTVGRILADRLGRPFADADDELERRLGRTIRAIFAEEGEEVFRERETTTLRELSTIRGLILATGGGAVLRETNRRFLRELGTVAWLRAAPEVIVRRLREDGVTTRPALTTAGTLDEVADVLAAREPLYQTSADFVVETDGLTPVEVAALVLQSWREHFADRADGPARRQPVGRMP